MKILITVDGYLPGYRFGGPLKSVANLVDWMGSEYVFFVFTRDRDLGDTEAYPGIQPNTWLEDQEGCAVYYAEAKTVCWKTLRAAIEGTEPDVIYINGLWEKSSRLLLWMLGRKRIPQSTRVVLAPRGALGKGALSIKPWRKKVLLGLLFGLFKIHRDLIWHATSDNEAGEIRDAVGSDVNVVVAPNLLTRQLGQQQPKAADTVANAELRFVFVSRLSPKKNLDFLLRALADMDSGIQLDIIGPVEDPQYFEQLKALVMRLPQQHRVKFLGGMNPRSLANRLPAYDFFILPTLNENFGHVILEAWAAGLPVITSDQTPWRNLSERQLGWDLPLQDPSVWIQTLENCCQMSAADRSRMRDECRRFYQQQVADAPLDSYRQLFGVS